MYYNHSFDNRVLFVFFGVFFLASGASALNQVQEKDYDGKMIRTWKRPVPMGLIQAKIAIIIAFSFIVSGLIILFFAGGIMSFLIGLLSILWYNGLYTILKKITAYAVFPGSLTGVFPILIGWTAAGGNWQDKQLLFISFFMIMWQIPHFLLLMLHYNDDYKKADFPTFSDFLNTIQIKRLILTWVTCTVIASYLLIIFNIITPVIFKSLLIFSGIVMIIIFTNEILRKTEMKYKLLFMAINSYMLLVMLLLAMNHWFV